MRDRPLLQPFAVAMRPSRLWLALVLASWLAYALLLSRYLPPAYLLSLPAAGYFAWRALRAGGWRRNGAWQRLEVDPQGRLSLCAAAESREAQVLDDCFVTPLLTVLNLRLEGRRVSLMLWPDSADAESRRQLRVYLLWFHPPQPSDTTETTP
ncbi:protein YgfX [Chromobacterium subtsugae]|uniref:protein YgfX n=1 Tax=Chromobacterium subtsugae TaxID=251747 RepID=UPI0006412071|nr:protein YgfX [Chromobacterium subtsugae]OBU86880.1 hypothetical protein MY55_08770 [Chromobacterium subtsugae]